MMKYLISVVIIALGVVGILSYGMKDEAPAQPLRFLYETKTGPVVFDHKHHANSDGAGIACAQCHHLGTLLGFNTDNGVVEFDHKAHGLSEEFGLECKDCHHLQRRLPFKTSEGLVIFEHQVHSTSEDYGLACDDCHHAREDGKPIQGCDACHGAGSDNNDFDKDAVHKNAIGVKCMECHEEFLEEEDGCVHCHGGKQVQRLDLVDRFPSCESCHEAGSPNNKLFSDGVHSGAVGSKCSSCHTEKVDDEEKGCHFCHGDLENPIVQGPMNCRECHFQGSKYNVHLHEGHPIHGGCPGAKCVSCHGDSIDSKDCAFCHKR